MTDHIVGAEAARAEIAAARAEGRRIDLGRADLYGAYLGGADLGGAYLYGADLGGANLYGADLTGADLYGANLTGANLTGADLTEANLAGANLAGASLALISLPVARLPEGTLQGYKKLKGGVICTLEIPKEAKRSSATSNKCRAEYAIPIAFSDGGTIGHSLREPCFCYTLGEVVRPDSFDDNRWNECAPGIHFFLTREEAEKYNY